MPIYNVSQMSNGLRNYELNNWSKTIELGSKMDFRGDFSEITDRSETKSFGEFLSESISQVNNLQHEANVATQRLASGDSKNLHETLLAVERADIAFKQMNQVRMKVIDAYKEIMRMQV